MFSFFLISLYISWILLSELVISSVYFLFIPFILCLHLFNSLFNLASSVLYFCAKSKINFDLFSFMSFIYSFRFRSCSLSFFRFSFFSKIVLSSSSFNLWISSSYLLDSLAIFISLSFTFGDCSYMARDFSFIKL